MAGAAGPRWNAAVRCPRSPLWGPDRIRPASVSRAPCVLASALPSSPPRRATSRQSLLVLDQPPEQPRLLLGRAPLDLQGGVGDRDVALLEPELSSDDVRPLADRRRLVEGDEAVRPLPAEAAVARQDEVLG